MWLRRMKSGSATHLSPCGASSVGRGTRPAAALSAACASPGASARTAARATPPIQLPARWRATCFILLLAQAHLDVARGADVVADVATDAPGVVGVDVAPGGGLRLRHLEHRRLRAVHHAVVALEAQAAAHAALGLGDDLRF